MVVTRMNRNEYEISLYWDDLTKETQEELLQVLGDNGNYDVVPISSFMLTKEEEL